MKKRKAILFVEGLFLTVQAVYFSLFYVLTVISSPPIKASPDENLEAFLEANLVILLLFLFATAIKSVIFSKILKLDLSYKGPDTFDFLPKWLKFSALILFALTAVYSLIFHIHHFFIITCAFTILSLVMQFSVMKYFSKAADTENS